MKTVTRQVEVEIDYGMSVEVAVQMCACPRTNKDICDGNVEDLVRTPSGNLLMSFKLVSFEEELSTEDVLERIRDQNKRPCTVKESLLLAASEPELQRTCPIIALGSIVRTGEERGVLFLHEAKRGLSQEEMEYFIMPMMQWQNEMVRSAQLGLYDNVWGGNAYFLVANGDGNE